MHKQAGVLCSGNVVWDVLVRPVEQIRWGTTFWVDSIEQHMGGNGANTAYALAVLGTPVRLVAWLGRDQAGDYLLQKLRAAGVDVRAVERSAASTPTTVALVNARGDRCLLHRPGVSTEAFAEPIEFTPELVERLSHYHLANAFALPNLRRHAAEVLRRARAAGLSTSLDTGWDSRGRWIEDLGPALAYVDLLFVNEDEGRFLTGASDTREVARLLRAHGARDVILKLGGRGCAVYTPDVEAAVPAFEVPVVDTTGAGDCFAGAFLAAFLRGRSHEQAARFANAAAALAIQRLGSTGGLRSYEETEAWMENAVAGAKTVS